jgi:D-alanine-D-alanine ligase
MDQKNENKKSNLVEVLGPVEDLEDHVQADWWRHVFNANYIRTDGDVVEDIEITRNEIQIFTEALGLTQDMHILDLCCGQGRHSLQLARNGFLNIYGIDRSNYLINRARKTNRQEGLNVQFKEGDARKLRFKNDFFDAIILAGNSFGYFESAQDDAKVLEEIKRVLKPKGKVLIDVTDGEYMRKHFEPRSWEWIDKNYFVCRERSLSKNSEQLISREVITHITKGVIADQFYAERLYSPEIISTIFSAVGFTSVQQHSTLTSASKRNQDLGMMARRIIMTAVIEKQWSVKKKSSKAQKVMVLLGDPNKTDRVKPNAQFDDDDFHTIKMLKDALSELKEYSFSFLDNHNIFISELQKRRSRYDFIF